MQQIINVKLGDWLPDQFNTELYGNLKEARNVLPTLEGYGPMSCFQKLDLPAFLQTCENFILHRDKAGKTHILAGCQSGLYVYKDAVWQKQQIKKVITQGSWQFAPWGEGIIINHPGTSLLYYKTETQDLLPLTSFRLQAQTFTTLRDYVFLGGFADHPYRLIWSALNNPVDFTSSLKTHADYQDLPHEKGKIQKITGAVIATDKVLYQLHYVGVPYIWQLIEIPESHGTIAAESVVKHNNWVFYLAESGFYLFDGKKIHPIGNQRVNKTVFKKMDLAKKDTIKSTIDPVKNLVFWSYLNKNQKRELLIYNWQIQQWSWSDQDITALGYFDQQIIGVYQNQLAALKGPPCQAVLETWDYPLIPTRRSWIMGIHVEGSHYPVEIQIKADDQRRSFSCKPKRYQSLYPIRSNGYRHRIGLHFSGPFTPQNSIKLKIKSIGKY